MKFSRRHFLKAAGQGIALTAIGAERAVSAARFQALTPSVSLPTAIARETATFVVNGKSYAAQYEARTTLWEVLAVKLGLTGTNRSCNRASCGACSVLMDGRPFYSCHTLAMEAIGKNVLTIEGVGTEEHLHPLQRIGHMQVAADCGFCTAGWVVTAKGLLDRNRNPSEADVKAALAGAVDVREPKTFEDAVKEAYALAKPDGVVLLAPACSSFDMFSNYAERGRRFKEEVRKLKGV